MPPPPPLSPPVEVSFGTKMWCGKDGRNLVDVVMTRERYNREKTEG
jgi:hypothetical protein